MRAVLRGGRIKVVPFPFKRDSEVIASQPTCAQASAGGHTAFQLVPRLLPGNTLSLRLPPPESQFHSPLAHDPLRWMTLFLPTCCRRRFRSHRDFIVHSRPRRRRMPGTRPIHLGLRIWDFSTPYFVLSTVYGTRLQSGARHARCAPLGLILHGPPFFYQIFTPHIISLRVSGGSVVIFRRPEHPAPPTT